jgi:hypothetical protein
VVALGVCAVAVTSAREARALDASVPNDSPPLSFSAVIPPEAATLRLAPFVAWETGSLDPRWATPLMEVERPRFVLLPGFLALGGCGSGAHGALARELAAFAAYNDPKLGCAGRCTETTPSLALPSSALAGIATLGIGVGLALLMSSPRAERLALLPAMRFKLTLRKAAATATWRF